MFQTLMPLVAAAMMQSGDLPTAAASALFGARPQVEQASLSPDGTRIAYISPTVGQGSAVFVVPLDSPTKAKPTLVASGKPERMGQCRWSANDRLLCHVYSIGMLPGGELAYISRWVGVDSDATHMKILTTGEQRYQNGFALYGGTVIDWLPDEDGQVLMMREYIPEYAHSIQISSKDGIALDHVDTRTGHSSSIEPPLKDVEDYISDGQGHARIRGEAVRTPGGYDAGRTNWFYRKKGSSAWQLMGTTLDDEDEGFFPKAVDASEDVVYGLKKLDGRLAAFKVALDGSARETLVYAHPNVDVDDFVRVGRNQRVVGVSFATDRRETVYFDPEFDRLAKSLARAIPNLPTIRIVDASANGSRLLIWAGSDTDPGRYFLFDKASHRLDDLMDVRPELKAVTLATVRPVTYKARDGTQVPAYLTLPPGQEQPRNLPAIVMPRGGPGARDEWGFDWLSQYFANRGFAVLQPNFRGSTGYGEEWFANNGFQSWQTAISDVDDGGKWLVSEGLADPDKLAIVGWSYGGYAALQSAATEPGLFKAAVAIAPVTNLQALKGEWRNWSNYRRTVREIGSGEAATAASPVRSAARIKVPVLMFHGTNDRNVSIDQSREMDSKLRSAGLSSTLIVYDGLDHQLEDGKARADMLEKTDTFLHASFRH